jgi:hypothetical protein
MPSKPISKKENDMNRTVKIFSFVLAIAILLSAIGTPALAAPTPITQGAPKCPAGRHQFTQNANGYFIWLDDCDVKNITSYNSVVLLVAALIPVPVLRGVAVAIITVNAARIQRADKGRGVIIFQYWWAFRLPFPINTWTWALTSQ